MRTIRTKRSQPHVLPLVAIPIAALVVAGCTDPTNDSASDADAVSTGAGSTDDVVVASGSDPDTFNPILGYARWGDGKVSEGLVELTTDLAAEPLLAQALPEISEDGLTYTVQLRDGVTFHDGTELGADDVVATYQAAIDPENASPVAADLTAMEQVEAIDELTVRFTLSEPQSSFVTAMVLGVVPAEVTADLDAQTTVPGTGPYLIDSYRPGDRLVLAANDDYWGEAPQVQRATFVFVDDDASRAARAASGEVDAAILPAQALSRYEDDPEWEVVRRDTSDFRALVMPESHPVAGDEAVRQALHTGIDRDALVEGALSGAGRPAFGPIPPEAPEYSDVVEIDTDLGAAQDLLEQAGWIEDEDGVRAKDGQRAEFTLMYPAGDSIRQNIALEVEAQAVELGIEVEPEGLSWESIEPRMSQDALVYGSGNPYNADLSTYALFHSSRAFQGFDNPGGYDSPQMDAALEAGRVAGFGEPERVSAYADVQEQLAEDLPWIFLAYVEHDYVIKADTWAGYDVPLVEPHEHGLQGGPWWNLQAWTNSQR